MRCDTSAIGLLIERAWAEAGGNVSRAGKILGVSRPTVYKLLKEHGFRE